MMYCSRLNNKIYLACYYLLILKKAFDTVSWSFISDVLDYFNFGNSIKAWVSLFQKGSETCILQNGFMSEVFNLRRGCRQGDSISPYLFILCAEILGKMVRKNNDIKGIIINGKDIDYHNMLTILS